MVIVVVMRTEPGAPGVLRSVSKKEKTSKRFRNLCSVRVRPQAHFVYRGGARCRKIESFCVVLYVLSGLRLLLHRVWADGWHPHNPLRGLTSKFVSHSENCRVP